MRINKPISVTNVTRIDKYIQPKKGTLHTWKDIVQALIDGSEVEIYYRGIGWQPAKRIPSLDIDDLDKETTLSYRLKE